MHHQDSYLESASYGQRTLSSDKGFELQPWELSYPRKTRAEGISIEKVAIFPEIDCESGN